MISCKLCSLILSFLQAYKFLIFTYILRMRKNNPERIVCTVFYSDSWSVGSLFSPRIKISSTQSFTMRFLRCLKTSRRLKLCLTNRGVILNSIETFHITYPKVKHCIPCYCLSFLSIHIFFLSFLQYFLVFRYLSILVLCLWRCGKTRGGQAESGMQKKQ